MKREPVESEGVAAVGYDPSTMTLEVEYRNGHAYRYEGVPRAVHRLLLQARSVGQFLNREVKPRFRVTALPAATFPDASSADLAAPDLDAEVWESASRSTLVAFYAGLGKDHRGRSFDQILAFSDPQLEDTHDYIQWLFPLTEPSAFNSQAPLLSAADRAAFALHPPLQRRLARAFGRMCFFYGFPPSAGASVRRSPMAWLAPGNHNYLRLTRMLKSLHLLGAEASANALWGSLRQVYAEYPVLIGPRTFGFWQEAAGAQR